MRSPLLLNKPVNYTKLFPINWNNFFNKLIGKTFNLAITSLIFFIIWRIGKILLNKYLFNNPKYQNKFTGRTKTLFQLANNIFKYGLLFFYVYNILTIFGFPVSTLIASAGIFSLAIGLGAQGFVNDAINGMVILSEDEFNVGDIVNIGTKTGTVIALGLRTTKLKTQDNTIIFIANRTITSVENYSHGGLGLDIDLQVNPKSDLELVRQAVNKANLNLKKAYNSKIKKGPKIIGIIGQTETSINFRIHFQITPGSQNIITDAYYSEYIKELKNYKIN